MKQAWQTAARICTARAFAVFASLALAGWASVSAVHAQDDAAALERRVKAAYMIKFASYVEWPEAAFAHPAAPVTIVVFGDDDLAAELSQITAGRAVEGRPLRIRKTRDPDAVADAHILFVGRAETARLSQLVRLTRTRPIVILTDAPGALNQGSVINFMLVEQRVKFEISLEEAERRGLKLSSRLLAVAQTVRKPAP
jgi:hypothetical protein